MSNLIVKIKSSKLINSGVIKKIKDKIYFKYINPREEKKTDKYRVEILRKIGIIFEGKRWMLSSGAFLFHYRDNAMDGQDLDIDILDTDFEKIKEKFFDNGFKIKQVFINSEGKITEYRFMYKDAEVDIFLLTKDKNIYKQMFTFEKNNAKNITKKVEGNKQIIEGQDYISYERKISCFKKIKKYNYENIIYNGPENAEQHLIELYGESWNVYDPNYDPKTSPENNKPVPHKNAKSIVYIKPVDFYEKF